MAVFCLFLLLLKAFNIVFFNHNGRLAFWVVTRPNTLQNFICKYLELLRELKSRAFQGRELCRIVEGRNLNLKINDSFYISDITPSDWRQRSKYGPKSPVYRSHGPLQLIGFKRGQK